MNHPEVCCTDEDEYQDNIRLSKDVQQRVSGSSKNDLDEKPDPIADAEKRGRRLVRDEDELFLRAVRMGVKNILYLDDRAKNCYKLREDVQSLPSLVECFKDEDKASMECECDVRNYLKEITKEKHEFAEHVAKHYRPKKDNKAKK